MKEPKSFYENELKSLLSLKDFKRLQKELPKKGKLFNKEIIHTTRYRPGDIRLRYSDKRVEVLCKEGDVTTICRREVVYPLQNKEELKYFEEMFELIGLKKEPSWIKHRTQYKYLYKGNIYVIDLQHILDFGYILEVEILTNKKEIKKHEPNLRAIVKELGCEVIEPKDFLNRVNKYIKEDPVNKKELRK